MIQLILFFFVLYCVCIIDGFYLPGVAPHSFASGDSVELKVNKLR